MVSLVVVMCRCSFLPSRCEAIRSHERSVHLHDDQRMCQNTRRCRTSQQARIQSVAAVAAWGWTDGDEERVSAWRQLSACRHWLALPWRSELWLISFKLATVPTGTYCGTIWYQIKVDWVERLRGVAKTYRVGSVDVEALRSVTLDIHKSPFSAVIGRAFTFSSAGHYDAQFV